MFDRQLTNELLGYDFDPSKRRRTRAEIDAQPDVVKKSELKVADRCPGCNKVRIITYRQSKKNKLCSKCFHNTPEMINAKQNQSKFVSEETKQKMKDNHWSKNGGQSAFKGKQHTKKTKKILRDKYFKQFSKYTEEYKEQLRIKGSCSFRGVSTKEFNGFVSPKNTRLRQSLEGKRWIKDVLRKYDYTCVKCNKRGGALHAHHLNAFNAFSEQRFDIDNGVCLCKTCHEQFHKQFGKGNNTKHQFQQFIGVSKPIIFLVFGVSGSGKSWVCKQLQDKFEYVSYDEVPKKDQLQMMLNANKPILHDRSIKTSTFIKRNSDKFDIRVVCILGDFIRVKEQLKNRGGKITKSLYKRWKIMHRRADKYAEFVGDSDEVYRYLRDVVI